MPTTELIFANVKEDFGAVGDGVTNDTEAIRNALSNNPNVYFPAGTYLSDYILMPSNTNIKGDGIGKTKIKYTSVPYLIKNNPQARIFSLLTAVSNSENERISNINISDLSLIGTVEEDGFYEWNYLTSVFGAENVRINNVQFYGFRGDGFMASGNFPYYDDLRHNKNVHISNCFFDGVNKNNRNCISITECDGFIVENSEFKNSSRPNMPGAIDFEPDTSFAIVRDCVIRNCTFTNIGGDSGTICLAFHDHENIGEGYLIDWQIPYIVPPNNFLIEGNTIDSCGAGITLVYKKNLGTNYDNTPDDQKIVIKNNKITNCKSILNMWNTNGVTIEGNNFVDNPGAIWINYGGMPRYQPKNTLIISNTFERCGTANSERFMSIGSVDGLALIKNKFNDSPNTFYFIDFMATSPDNDYVVTSKNVVFLDNEFSTNTPLTRYAIKVPEGHVTDLLSNDWYGNKIHNDLINEFPYPSLTYFGAIGNGIEDDTNAITNALNFAKDSGRNHLQIPIGTFAVSQGFNLDDNFGISGDNAEKSIIKLKPDTPPITNKLTQSSIFMGKPTFGIGDEDDPEGNANSSATLYGVTLQNFCIDLDRDEANLDISGNSFPTFGGILFHNPVNCTIDSIKILNTWVWGISFRATQDGEGCKNNIIKNCVIENLQWNVTTPPIIGIEIHSYVAVNDNGTTDSIDRVQSVYTPSKTLNNILLNNKITNGSHGIFLYNSSNNKVLNNTINGCSSHAVVLSACSDENKVDSNVIDSTGGDAILLRLNSCKNTVSKNTVKNTLGEDAAAIKSSINGEYNIFSQNKINDFKSTGISVVHGAVGNQIINNEIDGGSLSTDKLGIAILSNDYKSYYTDNLTFNDELVAVDNICDGNKIKNVQVPIKVGDAVTPEQDASVQSQNIVQNNVFIPTSVTPSVSNKIDYRIFYYALGGAALLYAIYKIRKAVKG